MDKNNETHRKVCEKQFYQGENEVNWWNHAVESAAKFGGTLKSYRGHMWNSSNGRELVYEVEFDDPHKFTLFFLYL